MTAALHTKRLRTFGSKTQTSGNARRFYFFGALHFNHILALCILPLAVFLASCVTAAHELPQLQPYTEASYIPEQFDWEAIPDSNGNAWYAFYENSALPLRYHCVKINLSAENLSLCTFPATAGDYLPAKTGTSRLFIGKRTPRFAKDSKAVIAINTAPFAGKSGRWDLLAHITRTRQIVGTHIVQGSEFSSPRSNFCALVFTPAEQGFSATIIDSQNEAELSHAAYAFGGFWTILRNNTVRTFAAIRDSRTACGVSSDGKSLYLLVVEGEHHRKSAGLTYMECAEIFKALGAEVAMEFDGGGSSSLVIQGKNMLSYPSLRVNAASLGFAFFIDDKPKIR